MIETMGLVPMCPGKRRAIEKKMSRKSPRSQNEYKNLDRSVQPVLK